MRRRMYIGIFIVWFAAIGHARADGPDVRIPNSATARPHFPVDENGKPKFTNENPGTVRIADLPTGGLTKTTFIVFGTNHCSKGSTLYLGSVLKWTFYESSDGWLSVKGIMDAWMGGTSPSVVIDGNCWKEIPPEPDGGTIIVVGKCAVCFR